MMVDDKPHKQSNKKKHEKVCIVRCITTGFQSHLHEAHLNL